MRFSAGQASFWRHLRLERLLAARSPTAQLTELAGLIVFLVASVMTLTALRPLVLSRLQSTPTLRTGAAALVGKRGVVLQRIVNHEGAGQVRIDHEVWTARSFDDDRVIEVGTQVEIIDIKGATALVME